MQLETMETRGLYLSSLITSGIAFFDVKQKLKETAICDIMAVCSALPKYLVSYYLNGSKTVSTCYPVSLKPF